MVDITPSLKTGIIDSDMAVHYCSHYRINAFDHPENDENGFYINRYNIENVVVNRNEKMGENACVKTLQCNDIINNLSGFQYQDNQVPLRYHRVSNPNQPGVKGQCIINETGIRRMIISGGLSGCGFAILYSNESIYVIHAGACGEDKNLNQRDSKMLINRDIYLMARALTCFDNTNDYDNNINNYRNNINLSDYEKEQGLLMDGLFERIRDMRLQGCIFVNNNDRATISNNDHSLILKSYQVKDFWLEKFEQTGRTMWAFTHDVICVVNEKWDKTILFRRVCVGENRVVKGCLRYIN